MHALPPAPHETFVSEAYASHAPPAVQQPFGHDVASQTHWPVVWLHSSPEGQAEHAVPPAPQDPFDSLDTATQMLPLQQPAHDVPPHVQTPVVHASPALHAPHAAPAVPHCAADSDA